MNDSQFSLTLKMLYTRKPLIGGWLRQRAARSLAASQSPLALQALAEALSANPDPDVNAIARQAILQAHTRAAIDRICQVWAERREPWLGQTLVEKKWAASRPVPVRLLCLLQTNQLDEILDGEGSLMAPLVSACSDIQPELAQRARSCLARLRRPAAINGLCAEWARNRAPMLEAAIIAGGYAARQPVELRVLSALKSNQAQLLLEASPSSVAPLLQAAQDRDPQIAALAAQTLRRYARPELRDALCSLFIDQDHPLAKQIALECGYQPSDPQRRALFFFLCGQIEAYLEIDFDQRILGAVYQSAPPALRQRILENVRSSGRAEILKAISGREVVVLSSDEAAFIAQMLIDGGDWPRLWERLGDFPLELAVRSVRALSSAGWRPAQDQEAALLASLVELASSPIESSAERLRACLPDAVQRARVRLTTGRINKLVFSPARPVIAVGTSQRKVAEWNFQSGQRQRLWSGFNASIGQVAYSASDALVFGERTNNHQECHLYLANDDQPAPLRKFGRSVTLIEAVGSSHILAGSRDGSLELIDLASRTITAHRIFGEWPRSARISPTGERAALLHGIITFLRLPGLSLEAEKSLSSRYAGLARCAVFTPGGSHLAIGKSDGLVLALPVGGHAPEYPLTRHSGRVLALESLEKRSLLVSLSANSEVRFTTWDKTGLQQNELAGKIHLPETQVTSLHVSGDGAFMALGDSQGGVSLWDLRVLDLPSLLDQPLASGLPDHLAGLQALLEADAQSSTPLPASVRRALLFIEHLLRQRFRFDVEIGEIQQIMTGEFDIDIEG